MKKFTFFLFSSLFLLLLPLFSSADTILGINKCADAMYNGTSVTDITYDYGPDGLVKFHFTLNGDFIAVSPFSFYSLDNMFSDGCPNNFGSYFYYYPPVYYPSEYTNLINISHLLIKAVERPDGYYDLKAFNEDTAEELTILGLPSGLNPNAPFFTLGLASQTAQYPPWIQTPKVRLKAIYNVPVPTPTPGLTPVLIVPGILGTELKQGDDLLWADIVRMINPVNSDSFMDKLEFISSMIPKYNNLDILGIIRKKIQKLPTKREITLFDYSDSLINLLISKGYTEGKDLFTFPYDWRYGASDNIVQNFEGQMQYILNQTDAGRAVQKVDVIAHSTGGLIVKKYAVNHPTDHKIGKTIFVGVPNLGAPKAVKVLLAGDNFDIYGLNDLEMKKLSLNFPVSYDLSPSLSYYNLNGSFLKKIDSTQNPVYEHSYNFEESYDYLVNHDANSLGTEMVKNSQGVHSQGFENFRLADQGIDFYNITGCKSHTFESVVENTFYLTTNANDPFNPSKTITTKETVYDSPKNVSGDSTVPFESSDSNRALNDHRFYAIKPDHGKMLSQDGIREKIVNILTGSSLPTKNIINYNQLIQNPEQCQLKGREIHILSPVDVEAIDSQGNETRLAEDGSVQNDIPGASLQIWGDHKYLFLPDDEGQQYQIKLKGTGNGTFTLRSKTIVDDQETKTEIFPNLPVTPSLLGMVLLGEQTQLQLDTDGDGSVDKNILPSSLLNPQQSQDLVPPVSTSTIAGTMGEVGFYRSEVKVTLSALDPVLPGKEAETSGVLKIMYNLDNQGWQSSLAFDPLSLNQASSSPLTLTEEGSHTLSFYSIDKAGNKEAFNTLSFTIDKTPPEILMEFDVTKNDIALSALDRKSKEPVLSQTNYSLPVYIDYLPDGIKAQDKAGNTTILKLTDKDRKKALKAEVLSLSYNSLPVDLTKTVLRFNWQLDKNKLDKLTQTIKSKKDFTLQAIFQQKPVKQTTLTGKDQQGKIHQTHPGLKTLKVYTDKGDMGWGW